MRVLVVLAIIGQFLRFFSLAFLAPTLVALVEGEWWAAGQFAGSMAITLVFGQLVSRAYTKDMQIFRRAEALAVVAGTWAFLGVFGALPYIFEGLTFVDALFESISGFTTTGATILVDFGAHGDAFYLWRSMTQWFGGLGVIALAVVVLPRLKIAGRQLFFAEASGAPGEAVSPKIRHAAMRLWLLYASLTVLLSILLWMAGMDVFNAICHALTTLSAGGFSPNPSSIAGFDSANIEWILIVFMVLSGTSFPLLWLVLARRPLAFFRDEEFMVYAAITAVAGFVIAALLWRDTPADWSEAIRTGLFQSASVISSTGFASTDYNLWGDGARVMIVLVMLVGGCAGSAAGGPKVIRHLFVFKHIRRELRRVLHPRAVMPIKYKKQPVDDGVMRAVFTLVFLYFGTYLAVGVFLTLMGHDMTTAFSASLATVGNVGPAFGEAGPMGNFAGFSDISKLVMTFGMWIGRLEIVTVFALFHRGIWKNLHLKSFSAR